MLTLDHAIQGLRSLGSDAIEHINSDLTEHLRATSDRLRAWKSADPLCIAGLFHAVYGTYGFHPQLIGIDRRSEVVDLIGTEAERIVYFYGACDRAHFCAHGRTAVRGSTGTLGDAT